jgi:hypothetical protein
VRVNRKRREQKGVECGVEKARKRERGETETVFVNV